MKLEAIRKLRKEFVILKSGKNGIVLIGPNDQYTTVENLFSHKSKFKEIYGEPAPASLPSIQRFLKSLTTEMS